VLSGRTSFEIDPAVDTRLYEVAGFKVAGKRAVRVDILERLADIIRPLIAIDAKTHQGQVPNGAAEANGFRVTVEMTSLLGCAGEEFASILTSLGYRVRRTAKPVASPEAIVSDTPAADATPPEATADTATESVAATAPEISPDAEDAAINEAAMDAVEGARQPAAVQAPPAEEAAAVDTATADLGAPAPEAPSETDVTSETDAKTEPQFDEVWFPGGRRPENKRPPRREPRENAATAVPAEGAEREHRPRPKRFTKPDAPGVQAPRPPRQDQRPHGEGEAKPRFEGKPRFAGKPKFEGKPTRNDPRPPPRERREPAFDPDSPFAALAALRNPKPE
jgi:ATP-dependent RNA helicase SUPV3L1/SUV3